MLKLLLDTHVLLWAFSDPKKLSSKAQREIESPENIIFVSLASLWEIQIKESINKIKLPKDFFQKIEPTGFEILPISLAHIQNLKKLPLHHRDPFDRMIISQALCEDIVLMTQDKEIAQYQVRIF